MKNKLSILATLSVIIFYGAWGQNVKFEWARKFSATPFTTSRGLTIAIDDSGYVYSTGYFEGTVDFDPGPGVYNLSSSGNSDAFALKMDSLGNLVWARKFGGTELDMGMTIVVDHSGNVLVGGTFRDTVDFDPGANTFNLGSSAYADIFIVKLNLNGQLIWAKQFNGNVGEDISAIAVDDTGNVYCTGNYSNLIDMDPGPGTSMLTASLNSEIFICKLDEQGNYKWAKRAGGSSSDYSHGLAIDDSANLYLTGRFGGFATFGSTILSGGSADIFICKLSGQGNFLWAKGFGSTGFESGWSIAIDGLGHLYATGYFVKNADFDPGPSSFNLSSSGNEDVFISKFDTGGNFIWARKFGGALRDEAYSICMGPRGQVFLTGFFHGTCDFDPGPGTYNLTSAFGRDMYIASLDSLGSLIWAKQISGSGENTGFGIAASPTGRVYTTGSYGWTADFDPGTPVFNQSASSGSIEVFVHKLSPCDTYASLTVTACPGYITPSGRHTLTTNGIYSDTLPNPAGCDHITFINFTAFKTDSTHLSLAVCDSLRVPSGRHTLTNSGVYIDTLLNQIGCDSLIFINLTILKADSNYMSFTTCNNFQSPSGRYSWNSTGNYSDTLVNSMGCDSIIFINLTVPSVDTSLSLNKGTLYANALGATYQWLDCNAGFLAVPGQNSNVFTPIANGQYAVAIVQGGCSDTSKCIAVNDVDLAENGFGNGFSMFPNPSTGTVKIDLGEFYNRVSIRISTPAGELVGVHAKPSARWLEISLPHQSGIYLIDIATSEAKRGTYKVIRL